MIWCIVLLLGIFSQISFCDESINMEFQVLHVIDGANIIISYNGEPKVCSYIGVVIPEGGLNSNNFKALKFNRDIVMGKTVRLEFDFQKKNKYGHLLSYVYCGEIFVNGEIIRQGYGTISIVSPNTKYAEQLLKLENDARIAKRGIWTEHNLWDALDNNSNSLEERINVLENMVKELTKKLDEVLGIVQKLQNQSFSNKSSKLEQVLIEMVYVTSSGKKYHKQDCSLLRGQANAISIEQAKKKGLEPCKICFGQTKP